MIAWVIGMSEAIIIICGLLYLINERPYDGETLEPHDPFVLSEYCAHMEQAALDILEQQEPVDQIIILWWGLDGLRLNEHGELEWVSRRKPKSVQENIFYQPCQSVSAYNPDMFDQAQSTRALIDALMAQDASLQMQALQAQQTIQLAGLLQQCCVQYPAQYPRYFYGGCCWNYIG